MPRLGSNGDCCRRNLDAGHSADHIDDYLDEMDLSPLVHVHVNLEGRISFSLFQSTPIYANGRTNTDVCTNI